MLSAVILAAALPAAQHLSARESGVRVAIVYRMRSPEFLGEGSPGPTIAGGSIHVTTADRAFTINLTQIGIPRSPSIFPAGVRDGCGAATPISFNRTGDGRTYVVIETIVVGKGCLPQAHVIDVASQSLLPQYAMDHPFAHRNDVPPSAFTPLRSARVVRVDRMLIPSGDYRTPWPVTVVRTNSGAFMLDSPSLAETPKAGETIDIGVLHDETFTAPIPHVDRVVRLREKHERMWLSLQTPVPAGRDRQIRYNMYFERSEQLAQRGRFEDALAAYKTALSYLDDRSLKAAEEKDAARYQSIVERVKQGKLTTAAAKALWFRG